jgi:hypothetical protein
MAISPSQLLQYICKKVSALLGLGIGRQVWPDF